MSKTLPKPEIDRLPLKIGSVPYANAWPLTRFLDEMFPGSALETFLPSQLQFRLIAHHLDVALMPIAALTELPTGAILGDVCIGCRGEVRSVLLLAKRPIEEVRHIAMDVSSRSSALLTEILFREFYDVDPKRYPLPLDVDPQSLPTDAFLIIGDPAMRLRPRSPWDYRYDLGELWAEKTGLPFVFAAWIACRDKHRDDEAIARTLQTARDRGCAVVETILEERAGSLPQPVGEMRSYFSEAMNYTIGPEEKEAVALYFDLATKHRLIRNHASVRFDP